MAMEFSEALQLAGPLIAAAGLISGVWWRMESKVDSVKTEADHKCHDLETKLSDFKLKVAEEYASWETVKAIETRLTERMDNLSEQVMKMPDMIVERMVNMIKLSSK